jgi:hypothetical protein
VLETLEHRIVPVVGAFAPSVAGGLGYDGVAQITRPDGRQSSGAIASGLSVGAVGTAASAGMPNLVNNPDFETGDFSGWTQAGNTEFDVVDNSDPHGGSYAATLGPVGFLGSLSQSLPTTPGQTYTLSFWLAHPYDDSTPNEFRVSIDGNTLSDGTNLGNFDYTQYSFNYTATNTQTTLRFDYQEDPAYFYLDDVSFQAAGITPSLVQRPVVPAGQTQQANTASSASGLSVGAVGTAASVLQELKQLSGMTAVPTPGTVDLPAPAPARNLAVGPATNTSLPARTALDQVFLGSDALPAWDRRAEADRLDWGQGPAWAF